MLKIPVVIWIANAAARLAGTHGDVTRQAATADGSRQTVDDHAQKVPAAVEAEHSGGPTRAEVLEQNQTPPAGECSTLGRARPDDRVPQGPATPVHRHRHNAPRKLVASGFEADNKKQAPADLAGPLTQGAERSFVLRPAGRRRPDSQVAAQG